MNTGTSSAAIKLPDGGDAGDATKAIDTGAPMQQALTSSAGSFVQIIQGSQAYMVAGGDASPWVLGYPSNNIFHYSNDLAGARTWNWVTNDNSTSSIAVSPEGTPWKIDVSGNISRGTYNDPSWTWSARGNIQGGGTLLAFEIGVGANNAAWAIARGGNCPTVYSTADCPIYQWNEGTQTWSLNQVGWARHITVSPDGNAYVANTSGGLYHWSGSSWQNMAGCMRHPGAPGDNLGTPVIAAADNTAIWVLGCTSTDNIFVWQPQASIWQNIPGTASSIGVTSDGTPWIVNAAASYDIYEYVSSWQSVGPHGFTFTPTCVDPQHCSPACDPNTLSCPQEILTGEVQDIAVALTSVGGTQGEGVTIGATTGGVWQTPPTFGWIPIGDVGAGVNAVSGPNAINGPSYAIGSLTVKPGTGDQNTVVVGTGVAPNPNSYANSLPGGRTPVSNGVWVGKATAGGGGGFTWGGVNHQAATMLDANGAQTQPSAIVKIRYSRDATIIYAIAPNALFFSTDDGSTFYQAADPNCAPSGNHVFTDLVVDPSNSSIVYVGVSGEGVYQATHHGPPYPGVYCDHGSAPPLYANAPPSTIRSVALAITASSVLYAAFAGNPDSAPPLNDSGDNFANIDATSTATWSAGWTTPVPAQSVPLAQYYGLNSQGGHDWALATNATGDVILLGGISLHRWDGCSATACGQTVIVCAQDYNSTPVCPEHHDYHSITWGDVAPYDHWVYAANDGGLFVSTDDGLTWQAQANSFAVANSVSVAPAGNNLYANAWDVGGSFSWDQGSSWNGDEAISGEIDGVQAAADPSHGYGFMCMNSNHRFTSETGAWLDKDNSPAEAIPNCNMAMGRYGSLFTTGAMSNEDNILSSTDYGSSWHYYHTSLLIGPPWGVVVSNENPPTVYALAGAPVVAGQSYIMASVNNQDWAPPVTPTWPANYRFIGTGAGAAATTDWSNGDLYVVGADPSASAPVVVMSPAASHGSSWIQLGGTNTSGTPTRLKQDERVTTVAVDASARTAIVGTDGAAPASSVYGPASVWRLNNPGATPDSSHHWRPWVNGLPIGTLPISQITGQYENGVYYFYAATWGRGIWKREARGGDL